MIFNITQVLNLFSGPQISYLFLTPPLLLSGMIDCKVPDLFSTNIHNFPHFNLILIILQTLCE